MDSSQLEGADFKSDVCQILSVEHFYLWHEIQDGRQEALFAGVTNKFQVYQLLGNLRSLTYFTIQITWL